MDVEKSELGSSYIFYLSSSTSRHGCSLSPAASPLTDALELVGGTEPMLLLCETFVPDPTSCPHLQWAPQDLALK